MALGGHLFGQATDSFDIATFNAPAGWGKARIIDSYRISTSSTTGPEFCLITITKSMPALGNSRVNFDAAWQTLVREAVGATAAPEVAAPVDTGDGWEAVSGHSLFAKDGANGVALLATITGHSTMMNVLILTNSKIYQKEIAAFLDSVRLKAPAAAAGGDVSAVVGKWAMTTGSGYARNNGTSSYVKREYTFSPGGTYVFLVKTFSYTMRELLFTREEGTYTLSGGSLTITPKSGYIEQWTKAKVAEADGRLSETDNWGKLVSTQKTKLETVTYRISKEYFSGIDEWQLIMQASAPTSREGPFVSSTDHPNSYFYKTQKWPIEPPK